MTKKSIINFLSILTAVQSSANPESSKSQDPETDPTHKSYKLHHDMTKIYPLPFTTIDPNTNQQHKRKSVKKVFLLDIFEVSNEQFEEFVKLTNYVTEAEEFGWSFVLEAFASEQALKEATEAVAGAQQ